ncbi:MAG: YqgE/AlgH family protein [Planctomycetota bacterium]
MERFEPGELLVASSIVDGTLLSRGVCLLVECDDDRVIGLMLNRPMQFAGVETVSPDAPDAPSSSAPTNRLGESITVSGHPDGDDSLATSAAETLDLAEAEFDAFASEEPMPVVGAGHEAIKWLRQQQLHFGGPLAGPLVALHQSAELAEAEAGEGIFVAATRDSMQVLLEEDPGSVRLILGHLGWCTEVLANEVDQGIWHRLDGSPEMIWYDNETMWHRLIRRATSRSVAQWMGVSDVPKANVLN